MHELDKAVFLLIEVFKEEDGRISPALENEKDGQIELDNALGLQIGGLVSFELSG